MPKLMRLFADLGVDAQERIWAYNPPCKKNARANRIAGRPGVVRSSSPHQS
jgi:hypothetical protein